MGVLISTHIADASAATTYTARGAVSENKFPKGPIEKAHEFSITSTERIERKERGKSTYPKTYNNTCLILFPLGSKIGGRVSSIFFLLSNSRVSVWVISNYVGLE